MPLAFPDPDRPKSFYLARVRRHREADELIRGTGWDGRRGCAVGCTLETYDHSLYPSLLGVPEVVARLEDWLFEGLPGESWRDWPERFLSAIPEGADLSGVYSAWCVRLLDRRLAAIGDGEEPWRAACRDAVRTIRDMHASGEWDDGSAARSAAGSAAEAAGSAAEAAGSAGSAAEAAEAKAAEAAGSAAWSARSAAGSAEILRQSEDLLEILASAPCRPAGGDASS